MNKLRTDSFVHTINGQLSPLLKTIGVSGIKAITDSTISVYNENGIKAMARFDNKANLVYEMSVTLDHLGIKKGVKFFYQIKFNGAVLNSTNIEVSSSGRFIIVYRASGTPVAMLNTPDYSAIVYPTDFWGEYTL